MTCKKKQDRLSIVGVKVYPRIGVTSEERSNPQECEADLTIWGDFEIAAAEDSLDKSVDYTLLVEKARETADLCEYHLLETLAHKMARNLLRSCPISRIRVNLRKRPVSLLRKIDFVEVEVEESDPDDG